MLGVVLERVRQLAGRDEKQHRHPGVVRPCDQHGKLQGIEGMVRAVDSDAALRGSAAPYRMGRARTGNPAKPGHTYAGVPTVWGRL